MTICASVKVRDGLVLATDSMSTIQGQVEEGGPVAVLKNYRNATKLFQIRGLAIGAMSYGVGNIGNRSIQGMMGDFKLPNKSKAGVKEVAYALFSFFKPAYDSVFSHLELEQQPGLGFYVAGHVKGKPFPDEWEFLLPRDSEPQQVRPEEVFGASWRGIEIPFTRLYKGYDPRIPQALSQAGIHDKVIEKFMQVVQGFESSVIYDGMPVQDAINFAVYILRTTIGLAESEIGPPSCGGPLQVAVILPETGFQWVRKPEFFVEGV